MKQEREILRFSVGERRLGVWMRRVEEILKLPLDQVTRLAGCPGQLLGLVNLRGEVIPVVDTRRIMEGIPQNVDAQRELTVLVYLFEEHLVGMPVDYLDDVVDVATGELEEVSDSSGLIECCFITKKDSLEIMKMKALFTKGLQTLDGSAATLPAASEGDSAPCSS